MKTLPKRLWAGTWIEAALWFCPFLVKRCLGMSGQKGRGHQAKFWCTGTRTLVPYSSFGHCHHQMIAAGRRKETKRRSLELLRGCLICPLVDRAGPGEKGKVKTVHCCRSFVFLTSCWWGACGSKSFQIYDKYSNFRYIISCCQKTKPPTTNFI